MAVSVKEEPVFEAGKLAVLFKGPYVRDTWDIHPDGSRFLMLKPTVISDGGSSEEAPRRINIVLNWFEELKDRGQVD